jgi:hypothetical protein
MGAHLALGAPGRRREGDNVGGGVRAPPPESTMSRPEPPLPTFLIIGAQKSATRWLRVNLGEHPDIYTAPRELSYFNRDRRVKRSGLAWYRSQFEGWNGEPVVGEATPGYMIHRHDPTVVAKRIDRFLPDVRLVAILRNPIDRANSALAHHARRRRLSSKATLLKTVRKRDPNHERLGLIAGGWYAASLRPYFRRFGPRLLVLLHDDVQSDPRGVYERALRHVGAEPSFVPEGLERVVFSNRRADDKRAQLSQADRLALWEYFRDDVRHLQWYLRRDLSMWDPSHEPETAARATSSWRAGSG